ncbi:MAG TPA: hypothetical protein DCE42_29975 [Myxococcales bacterium]|nr:hypothetical protein [Myxococcales bacterium]
MNLQRFVQKAHALNEWRIQPLLPPTITQPVLSLHREENRDKRLEYQDFLQQLATALQRYGTPAHRLQQAITDVSKVLGMEVHIFSTPTGLFMSFVSAHGQETSLHRVTGGELHLERQSDIDELVGGLIEGELSVCQARRRLEELAAGEERYSAWMMLLAFGVSGLSIAVLLGVGWLEVALSFVGGSGVGALTVGLGRFEQTSRLLPVISSFLTALFVTAMASFFGPIAQSAIHLSSIIILVPGLSLTVAMTEISTQHLASGTARLSGAMQVMLQLGFGLAVGNILGQKWFGVVANQSTGTLGPWFFWSMLPLASLSFLVLFRARPGDVGWIILAGFLAIGGSKLGTELLGDQIGPFLGAFSVALTANMFARTFKRPTSICMIPGIIFLVPGSIGLHSISAMFEKNTVGGMETAFTMMIVTVSLVFGVLFATLLLPPRRHL